MGHADLECKRFVYCFFGSNQRRFIIQITGLLAFRYELRVACLARQLKIASFFNAAAFLRVFRTQRPLNLPGGLPISISREKIKERLESLGRSVLT